MRFTTTLFLVAMLVGSSRPVLAGGRSGEGQADAPSGDASRKLILAGAVTPQAGMLSAADAQELRQRGTKLRATGVALVLVGLSLAGTGIFMASTLKDHTCPADSDCLVIPVPSGRQLGIGLAVVGTGTTVAGVPLWAVGQSRIDEAKRSEARLSIAPAPSGTTGASLRLDF